MQVVEEFAVAGTAFMLIYNRTSWEASVGQEYEFIEEMMRSMGDRYAIVAPKPLLGAIRSVIEDKMLYEDLASSVAMCMTVREFDAIQMNVCMTARACVVQPGITLVEYLQANLRSRAHRVDVLFGALVGVLAFYKRETPPEKVYERIKDTARLDCNPLEALSWPGMTDEQRCFACAKLCLEELLDESA